MELEPIADYLELKGVGLMGKTIFVGEMPVTCQAGLLLLDRYSGTPIDPNLPKYRVTGFRVASRDTDYDRCRALARRVNTVLTFFGEQTVGPLLIKQMLPQNDPRPYRRSVGGFWEAEVDFDVNFVHLDPDLLL